MLFKAEPQSHVCIEAWLPAYFCVYFIAYVSCIVCQVLNHSHCEVLCDVCSREVLYK